MKVGLASATANATGNNSSAGDRLLSTRRAVNNSATPPGMASASLLMKACDIVKLEAPTMASAPAAATHGETLSARASHSSEPTVSTVKMRPATRYVSTNGSRLVTLSTTLALRASGR
ncbi:MAG: hypothetical protein IPH38_18305 [Candidatus Microthrix sp.]|nr:hypothetical protein [Candidatus Microthrix sp.]MBK7021486.1 hypothetical protein [Candidatus Microthrix sp.]